MSERRVTTLAGRQVGVTTHKIGNRFSCRIDNVDPGAVIGRGTGSTPDEAEEMALANAALSFNLKDANDALRRSVEQLRKPRPKS